MNKNRNVSRETHEQPRSQAGLAQTGLAQTGLAQAGLGFMPWLPVGARSPFSTPDQPRGVREHAPITALGTEWMDFVNRRLRDDLALPRKLAVCRGPHEMWRTYSEFLLKMANDYQVEYSEFARLGQEITESVDPLAKP